MMPSLGRALGHNFLSTAVVLLLLLCTATSASLSSPGSPSTGGTRRLLHHNMAEQQPLVLQRWLADTALPQGANGSCFPGGTVHTAADIHGQ